MSVINFLRALKYVLIDEGGNDDDPVDRGGRTSRGITQREYDAWCQVHGQQAGDVWHASDATITAIYHIQYWSPWCDRLPNAIDYLYFDVSVNSGAHRAALLLQAALNDMDAGVEADGVIGVVTAAAANALPPEQLPSFVDRFSERHLQFFHDIVSNNSSQAKFIRGWTNRVNHAQANARAMMEAPLVS
jgi:lysozyme family protein